MFRNKLILSITIIASLIVVALGLMAIINAMSKGPATVTTSEVLWTWGESVGTTSQLVRTSDGISAEYDAADLAPDQAMTLWFIVFNHPALCADGPFICGQPDLGKTRPAQGDFLVASGQIIPADGSTTFVGRLKVGDTAGSGLLEFPGGCIPNLPDCGGPVGLINLEGALIVLAIHSHGPKLTGEELEEQLSSYFGGCKGVIGTGINGFAASEAELPINDGECATIQVSEHPPPTD